jgi:hypothetical protein
MFYGVNEKINLNVALIFSHFVLPERPGFFIVKTASLSSLSQLRVQFRFHGIKIFFYIISKPINKATETLDDAL